MDLTGLSQTPICLYCETYQMISPDYPVNPATFRQQSEVPRCQFHSQYSCDRCGKSRHFNGIAWCHVCRAFTCIYCSEYSVVEREFFVYDYYYAVDCGDCEETIVTLDVAEVEGTHPYQIGDLRPEGILQVWLPLSKVDFKPELKSWGNTKIRNMTIDIQFEPVEEIAGDSKSVWDTIAQQWVDLTRNVDVNHREIIIPQMLAFMDPGQKIVMDVGCGEGTFTRKLCKLGYKVTGTDVSRMMDYAIEVEEEDPHGITYQKISVHDLSQHYEEDSFDQVCSNMAVMDIDNLPGILDNIRHILKADGQFVFSITHPVFAWPVSKTIKLPRDSQHNEDKAWVVDRYLDEQPVKVHPPYLKGPMLYYPRMLSTYVNSLLEYGFLITGLAEPKPDEETIMSYPRDMYHDYDRNPIFMVFRTKLIEDSQC